MNERKRRPFRGSIELGNGESIEYLRFAESPQEAIHIVKSQHPHYKRCCVISEEVCPPNTSENIWD